MFSLRNIPTILICEDLAAVRKAAAAFASPAGDNGRTDELAIGPSIAEDIPAPQMLITKRVGIKKAVDMPLRYIVAGNRFVSGKPTAE